MDPRALPERRLRRGAARRTAVAALALASAAGLAGCLCPPTVDELADLGYRSPSQTLRTFQLAVRADSPRTEYGCLSVDFRRRNGLSQIAWREFREEWFASNPFLRRGIAKAEIVSEERATDDFAVIVAEAYGRRIVVELVREAFYQIYEGERLVGDDLLPDQRGLGQYVGADPLEGTSSLLVRGAIEVPPSQVPAVPTELRIGLEWKIDGIRPEPETAPDSDGPNP